MKEKQWWIFQLNRKSSGHRVYLLSIFLGEYQMKSFLLQDAEKVNRVQKTKTKFRKYLSEVIRCSSLED